MTYDVVVIGGGAAGLSGALTLARSRRSVLVVDAGAPRNAPADGVHGFLTRDGMAPGELVTVGRAEVERYGGEVLDGEVVAARRTDDGFDVDLGDCTVSARRLLVTTGLVDELPDVAGLRERWGHTVVHCPYCHGWEVRDQPIGILGTNARATHGALLFRQLSDDVKLFLHTAPMPTDEELEHLAARGIEIVEGVVEAFDDDGVHLAGGTVVPRSALAVATRMVARTGLLDGLGLEVVEHPMGVGVHVPAIDPTGRTAVPGVWVAGNVTDLMAQVVAAAAGGVMAGAALNADLVAEDAERAAAQHRSQFTQPFWDARYGATHQVWSGNPNPQLMAEVAGLTPGTALDVGSGEGADAIWLAEQGWDVTAVDVSTVALERAAARATEVDVKVVWEQADALTWDPAPRRFDLVSAQFMHLPRRAREALHRRLAAAVRPGGTLLVVGHHPWDLETTMHRSHLPGLLFTAEDVLAQLDPDEWEVLALDARPREAADPEGRPMQIHDAVLHARRRVTGRVS